MVEKGEVWKKGWTDWVAWAPNDVSYKINTQMPNILLSKGYSCMAKMDAFWPSKSRRFYSSMSSALCSEGACYEHMSLVKSREDNQWIQLDDSLCLCNLWGNWGATCSDFSVKNHRASWYIWFFRQKFGFLRKSLYSSETLGHWPGVTFAA